MPDKVRLNEAGIRAFLLNPAGRLAEVLREKAADIANIARSVVRKRTGHTAATIEEGYHDGPEYQSAEVSAAGAVFFLERGSKPHLIFSHGAYSLHNAAPEFAIPGSLGYFGHIVHHPGNGRAPFLTVGLWTTDRV